jgi:hypothetical protein
MPPAYVKPYVKRWKNDAADADQNNPLVPRIVECVLLTGT